MEKLNPFLKMLTILISAVMLSFGQSVVLNLSVAGVSLILLLGFSGSDQRRLGKILLPIAVVIAALYMAGYKSAGQSAANLNFTFGAEMTEAMKNPAYLGLRLSSRVMAYAGLSLLFAFTTKSEDFMLSLMHQAHVKPKLAYGILAAFHLIPQISRELEDARLAYAVRGIRVRRIAMKPFFAAMVNCMRWSETMAMAMESKGFDGDGDRTFYRQMVVHGYDIAAMIVTLVLVAAGTLNSILQIVPML